jgi:hypothetical protein
VLQIYKDEVDPAFTWDNFTIEEQAKILAAGRSNNFLDTGKLEAAAKELGMPLPDIHTAVRQAMKEARASLEAQGTAAAPRPRCPPPPLPPAPAAPRPSPHGALGCTCCPGVQWSRAAEFAAVENCLGTVRVLWAEEGAGEAVTRPRQDRDKTGALTEGVLAARVWLRLWVGRQVSRRTAAEARPGQQVGPPRAIVGACGCHAVFLHCCACCGQRLSRLRAFLGLYMLFFRA